MARIRKLKAQSARWSEQTEKEWANNDELLVVYGIGAAIVAVLLAGAAFTIQAVMTEFGL